MKQAQQSQKNVSPFSLGSASEKRNAGPTTAPFVDSRPETAVQRKLQETARQSPQMQQLKAIQEKTSNAQSRAGEHQTTGNSGPGLPNGLRHGIEQLSGYSMDDVSVHYNSAKPAQVHAHAFAKDRQIHLASGQEKHLPHEAWHVVQQMQGRVKPTMQMKGGVNVNDDAGLEHEADVMGAKANELGSSGQQTASARPLTHVASNGGNDAPIQGEFPPLKYLKSDSQSTMGGEWDEYLKQVKALDEWFTKKQGPLPKDPAVPWVEVNDLYVGLTPTGNGSWPPIVIKRFGDGDKNFTVFTGSHGNSAGQFLDKDGNYAKRYHEPKHTKEDTDLKNELEGEKKAGGAAKYPGLNIEIVDIFRDGANSPEKLKAAVHERIASGKVVILAWCFSLEGFTARQGPEGTEEEEKDVIGKRNNVAIADIVAEQYGDLAKYKKPVAQ